jgi:hypothetical protein
MAHMQLATGVGEHSQTIKLVFALVFANFKGLVGGPILLRVPFYLGGIVMLFDAHETHCL